MKRIIFSIVMLLVALSGMQAEDKVLLTIDGEPIMQSEFLYIYEKNNQETAIDQKSLDEYLDLFINFKLKVHEAERQGLDTTLAFKKEWSSYRQQAMPKYMRDTALEESMVRLSYDHMSRSRRVAHIAIECPPTANDSVYANALSRIEDARERIVHGKRSYVKKGKKMVEVVGEPEDFFSVAAEVSEDPSAKTNRGEIGWLTPFRFVWPFEKAAYATAVGSVSEVFRTPYGLHILLVEEERPFEEVRASHIMKMRNAQEDPSSTSGLQQLEDVYARLQAGEDFHALAKTESEDRGSAGRGGDLSWFGRGAMVQPFDSIAFALQPGEMSEPFATRFGWHIILKEGHRGIQPLDSLRSIIQDRIARDERHKEVESAFVEKLRKEYGLPESLSQAEVLAYEESRLEDKYPEFRHLMQEYHDGILLFDVSLQEVWDKATIDTAGIEQFFATTKSDYTWDEPRYKGLVFYCKDKNTMQAVKRLIKVADPDSIQTYIDHRINLDSTVYVRSEKGLWKKGQQKAVDKLVWKSGEYEAMDEYPYVFVSGKKLKSPEVYTDERGKVTTAYQDYLEKRWIENLREKYEVKVNQEAFDELKK